MKAVTRERLPSGPGRFQELHPQAGDARKILIEGDDGEISLQSGGRNERVHIPNQAWAMGRSHGASNMGFFAYPPKKYIPRIMRLA